MFEESINYLRDSDDAVKTVLVGGLLSLFAFLVLPALVVEGYVIRVLDRVADGDTEVPSFDDWTALAVDGLKAIVVVIVYGLVPAILAAVFVGGGVLVADSAPLFGGLVVFVGTLLTFLTALAIWYVVPAALVHFARTRRIGAGFDFDALRPVLVRREYATGWLLALGVLVGAGVVAGVLAAVPFLGWLAGFFVVFYAQVTAAYLYARSYAEASEHAVRTDPGVEGRQPAV